VDRGIVLFQKVSHRCSWLGIALNILGLAKNFSEKKINRYVQKTIWKKFLGSLAAAILLWPMYLKTEKVLKKKIFFMVL